MTWSWADFSAQLARALDDEDEIAPIYSDAVRLDGLNAALRAASAYRPAQATSVHTNASTIAVPADCYKIAAVAATLGDETELLQPAAVSSTAAFEDIGSFWVWGSTITLNTTYDRVTLYYYGYYPAMEVGVSDIPVPTWAREAIVFRAAAYCLVPNLVSRARLGAYHDREDAPPLQNSLIQAAEWFIKQFERIMTEHKAAT